MNITHPTQQSPLKRNGAVNYVHRYLNTVSDWKTYAGADITRPQSIGDTVRRVTTTYFSPGKLKGVALMLAAHVAQQVVANLTTAIVRTTIHGEVLDTVHGIAVRRSNYHVLWNRIRPEQLATIADMRDSYYFHEGGRTWHVFTLSLSIWDETRMLSVLTLLGMPNRAFYFDRPLAYPQAVPLALGLTGADTLPGFLGDTNELDALVPPLRALKLGLYLLNWLLVDPAERDSGLPEPTPYSDLTPPPAGTATRPVSPTYPSYTPNGGFYGDGYGSYAGAAAAQVPPMPPMPAGTASPVPPTSTYPMPVAAYPAYNGNGAAVRNGNGVAAYTAAVTPTLLVEQPVSVLITVSGREQWHTVSGNAFVLRTASGRDTGLAITPAIELLADGRVVEHDTRWSITHLGSGRQLNHVPFTGREQAQSVGATLLFADWTRAVDDIPSADLDRAQTILARTQAVNGGGNHV